MPVAPAATFVKVVQSWPQVPQLRGSLCRFTQADTHRSGEGETQLLAHFAPDEPGVHSAVAPLHLMPQAPQLLASVRLASQPSSDRDEQ